MFWLLFCLTEKQHLNLRSPHTHKLPATTDYSPESLFVSCLKHLAFPKTIFVSKLPHTVQIRKLLNYLSNPSFCVASHIFNYLYNNNNNNRERERETAQKFLDRNNQNKSSLISCRRC